MLLGRKKTKKNMDGIRFIVSMMVCFQEISTAKIDPKDGMLQIAFELKGLPSEDDFGKKAEFIKESIHTYHSLIGFKDARINIKLEGQENAGFLRIERDMDTLSHDEISLICALVHEDFEGQLITEPMQQDDNGEVAYGELLDNMLTAFRDNHIQDYLVGVREAGKVLVYDS